MATQQEVAERAGVTVTTVSRMLNNRGSISDKTRKKILRAMAELDYQPNEIAQSLSKKQQRVIGLIVPSASNYFFCKVIDSVEKYVATQGYKLLLCVSNHNKKKELEYFSMLKSNKVAGIILASRTQGLLDELNFDCSIVTIDRQISSNVPSVCSDNYGGGVMAAEHLIDKGCRNPAYFSGSPTLDMDANKRFVGFNDALAKYGIKPQVLELSEEQFFSMDYMKAITGFLRRHPDIDGAFASNDVIASQIIKYCKRHDIAVPGQLKIVGYDDIDLAALYDPAITTIRQPIDDICRYAVDTVIHHGEGIAPISVTFPVTLMKRETT